MKTKSERAVGIGMRGAILTVLTLALTLMASGLVELWTPHQASIAVRQLEDDNGTYARARALATFDAGQWIWGMGLLLLLLVWGAAAWQWHKLAQEAASQEGGSSR